MISSIAWIPRGCARSRPMKFEASSEEIKRFQALAKEQLEENSRKDSSIEEPRDEVDISDLPPELRMDEYDDEDNYDVTDQQEMDDEDEGEAIDDPSPDAIEKDDLYEMLEEGGRVYGLDADSEDEDAEDEQIDATDALLVAAITEDDYSHLEVHVLTQDGTLYVHHDITLPDFPLCLAWLDCPPYLVDGKQVSTGNYIAVGSFEPSIEIWNLDVLDPLEPTAVLGGYSKDNKKKKSKSYLPGSHTDAVMTLSWNTTVRNILSSGSADGSIKLWDVTTQQCSHTFAHHKDKVQSVVFHETHPFIIASGSYDKTLSLMDCRNGSVFRTFPLSSDVESLNWNPFQPYHLFGCFEDGSVACFDIRKNDGQFLFSFQAHEKTTTSLSFSSRIPGMLATSSIDKTVKVWDVLSCDNVADTTPPLIGTCLFAY